MTFMNNYPPLDPNAELFTWGPIPGHYFYMSDFVENMYPEMVAPYSGFGFPKAVLIFKDSRMVWVNEFSPVREVGKRAFEHFILDDEAAESLYESWSEKVRTLNEKEKELDATDLSGLTDSELAATWKDFHAKLSASWPPSIVIEMANYGSDAYLIEAVRPYVKNDDELVHAVQVLASPETLSFFQNEEIDLQETSDLQEHHRRHYWLKNSYAQVEVLPVEFFEKRKKELTRNVRAECELHIAALKKEKQELKARYNLPDSVMHTAHALWRSLMWQDERKAEIFKELHYKKLFLEEAARRLKQPFSSFLSLGASEATSLHVDPTVFTSRADTFGFVLSSEGITELEPDDAEKYWGIYAEPKHEGKVDTFRGIVVSKGKSGNVTGRVRIVLDPNKTADFVAGEILVAPMTSPDYIFAMKQASAIITDTGGLTSHAAIVSRELGVPCLVGTKVATHVLKDGDLVEVDAEKGIVRLLES